MKKEDRIRVERKFQQSLADAGYTQEQFTKEMNFRNYLEDELVVKANCSNQFAWEGEQTCPPLTDDTICEHMEAVSAFMVAKFPHLKEV